MASLTAPLLQVITGLGKSYLGVLVPRTIVGVGEAAFAAGGTA